MQTILITGGTGLVGGHLIPKLTSKGYKIHVLSRSKQDSKEEHVSFFKWNIKEQFIEDGALDNVDYIIHLAGAGIADSKWTDNRKEILIDSRVDSLQLIYDEIKKSGNKPAKLISTSGIGYYGAYTTDKIFEETDKPGEDFVSEICVKWEQAASQFLTLGMNVVIPRVAVVLADNGGALDRMKTPTKFNIGSPLGSGEQYMPWIHMDDVCRFYIEAIENEKINGVYNLSADEHVTNKVFSKTLASTMGKAHFFPNVPAFMLKLLFGEMANIILKGSRVSNEKLNETGFDFKFRELKKALADVIN